MASKWATGKKATMTNNVGEHLQEEDLVMAQEALKVEQQLALENTPEDKDNLLLLPLEFHEQGLGCHWPVLPVMPNGRLWLAPVTENWAVASHSPMQGVLVPRQHGPHVLW